MMLGLGEAGGRLTIPLGQHPTAADQARCAALGGYFMEWMEFTKCEVPSDPSTYRPPYTGPVVAAAPSGPASNPALMAVYTTPVGTSETCGQNPDGTMGCSGRSTRILGMSPNTLLLIVAGVGVLLFMKGGR